MVESLFYKLQTDQKPLVSIFRKYVEAKVDNPLKCKLMPREARLKNFEI